MKNRLIVLHVLYSTQLLCPSPLTLKLKFLNDNSKIIIKRGTNSNKTNSPPPFLKLAFTNIHKLRTNLDDDESFLLTNSPDILKLTYTPPSPLTTLTCLAISYFAVRTQTNI